MGAINIDTLRDFQRSYVFHLLGQAAPRQSICNVVAIDTRSIISDTSMREKHMNAHRFIGQFVVASNVCCVCLSAYDPFCVSHQVKGRFCIANKVYAVYLMWRIITHHDDGRMHLYMRGSPGVRRKLLSTAYIFKWRPLLYVAHCLPRIVYVIALRVMDNTHTCLRTASEIAQQHPLTHTEKTSPRRNIFSGASHYLYLDAGARKYYLHFTITIQSEFD